MGNRGGRGSYSMSTPPPYHPTTLPPPPPPPPSSNQPPRPPCHPSPRRVAAGGRAVSWSGAVGVKCEPVRDPLPRKSGGDLWGPGRNGSRLGHVRKEALSVVLRIFSPFFISAAFRKAAGVCVSAQDAADCSSPLRFLFLLFISLLCLCLFFSLPPSLPSSLTPLLALSLPPSLQALSLSFFLCISFLCYPPSSEVQTDPT